MKCNVLSAEGGRRGINMIKKIFSVVLSVSILICSGVQVAKADTVDWQDGQGYEYPVTPLDEQADKRKYLSGFTGKIGNLF